MAIPDSKKVDYLWKKLGFGATKTDTNAAKKAPNEAITSPLLLRGDKVWNQASSIPSVLPGSSSGVVTVYPTSGPNETTADATSTANRTWKTGLGDWIPPEIGSTYQVKIYIHTSSDASGASGGDQVFATGSGNDDEWFFDYQSGVVHFIGTNLPSGISFSGKSVYVSGGRYTGAFGAGGGTGDMSNVVEDTTPQLGGALDVNGQDITSASNGNISIDPNGTGFTKVTGTNAMFVPTGTTAQQPGTIEAGMIRINTTTGTLEYAIGDSFTTVATGGSALSDVVDDTTPQLGGSLDVNGQSIVSVSNGDITVAPNGTGKTTITSTTGLVLPTGTTAQRSGSASTGELRFNSDNTKLEIYDGSAWTNIKAGSDIAADSFTGDSSETGFTISRTSTTAATIVMLNGVVQVPTTAYAVSGTTLTFTEAPATGDVIDVRLL